MTITVEPISGDELVGYLCAMLSNGPWGEPEMADEGLPQG